MINSGLTIRHDLDSGEIVGKFSVTEFEIPKREALRPVDDLEDLATSLLSEAISAYVLVASEGEGPARDRMRQGFKAARQLKEWLELHRGPDPTKCAECAHQM